MTAALYAIDASVYIFRNYFALQPRWQSVDGRPTEAVYGFAAFLLKLLRQEQPRYVAAAFDESLGTGFRHRLYPQYKANRVLPDDALAFQLKACRQLAEVLGIATFAGAEYEADDYLAALAARAQRRQQVFVISRDKDLAQLIDEHTALWDYGYAAAIDRTAYRETKGLDPERVADYLALVGDPGDNIPGVPGVGAKTATAILAALGPLDDWLDTPDLLARVPVRGSGGLAARIAPFRQQIRLARQLTTLTREISAVPPLPALRWRGVDGEAAVLLFRQLGLDSLEKSLAALPGGNGGRLAG